MRPLGTQSRFTTPWYCIRFSSFHFFHVSSLGKYVSTLSIFLSFYKNRTKVRMHPGFRHSPYRVFIDVYLPAPLIRTAAKCGRLVNLTGADAAFERRLELGPLAFRGK